LVETTDSALLCNSQDVETGDFTDIVDFSFVLALDFSVRHLLFQIPYVNCSGFIACNPRLKVLQIPDVCLVLLT
jgi:hypothetical protein